MADNAHVTQRTPRFARARTLAKTYDVSIATIWRWTANGRLPAPRRLGPNTVAWNLEDVERALAAGQEDASR